MLVESGIRDKFACGMRNPGNFCLWNPEAGKFLLVESGILGWNQVPGIRNPRAWNPESNTILDSLEWGVRSAV